MQTFAGRSFTGPDRRGGNGFRIHLLATDEWPDEEARQRLAASVAEPGTAFVDPSTRQYVLHNRMMPRRFVAHTTLGVLEVLASIGWSGTQLLLPTGPVAVWSDDDGRRWAQAPASWSPNDRHRQVPEPADVDAIPGPPADEPVQVWAWIDENRGRVRARQFAPSEGKPEDEACGSASMVLAQSLGRDLVVQHGRASEIQVRVQDITPAGMVSVGGFAVLDSPGRQLPV
ncbi:hypothetical protein [Kribbella sp. NPDC023855]|uniref:hypothetical protein n=1 Tax=Kribbella sp. NPDC023855 TaxID=3154698 RepID=UPI0033DFEBE8